MGFDLIDLKNKDDGFSTNFWHWHALVELIRSLQILPKEKVDSLHDQYMDTGLSGDEARIVAAALRSQILPGLDENSVVAFDGKVVRTDLSHGTTRAVLERFADYCDRSGGFTLW